MQQVQSCDSTRCTDSLTTSRTEISIRSWARARPRSSSREEEQGGELHQTSCPLNMWPGLLPTWNHSSTGLHWMLALGSQPLVPPAQPGPQVRYSLILLSVDSGAPQWYLTTAPLCYSAIYHCSSLNDAEPWHTGAPTSSDLPPPALSPASGLWTTKDTAQAMNSLSRRWRGLSAIAIPFQQPCLLLGEATHKILELQ